MTDREKKLQAKVEALEAALSASSHSLDVMDDAATVANARAEVFAQALVEWKFRQDDRVMGDAFRLGQEYDGNLPPSARHDIAGLRFGDAHQGQLVLCSPVVGEG